MAGVEDMGVLDATVGGRASRKKQARTCCTTLFPQRCEHMSTRPRQGANEEQQLVNKGVSLGFLTGTWTRGSFRSRNGAKTAVTPKSTPGWVVAPGGQTPGAHDTTCR